MKKKIFRFNMARNGYIDVLKREKLIFEYPNKRYLIEETSKDIVIQHIEIAKDRQMNSQFIPGSSLRGMIRSLIKEHKHS